MKNLILNPCHSAKIISLGDTFDLTRVKGFVSPYKYWLNTKEWHQNIEYFIKGNHDAKFLEYIKCISKDKKILDDDFVNFGPVLCFHGHQPYCGIGTDKEKKWLNNWDNIFPKKSLFYDIEEWLFVNFVDYFRLSKKSQKQLAIFILKFLDKEGKLGDNVKYVISGHTHLAFNIEVEYKGKRYIVVNCGSAL